MDIMNGFAFNDLVDFGVGLHNRSASSGYAYQALEKIAELASHHQPVFRQSQ